MPRIRHTGEKVPYSVMTVLKVPYSVMAVVKVPYSVMAVLKVPYYVMAVLAGRRIRYPIGDYCTIYIRPCHEYCEHGPVK